MKKGLIRILIAFLVVSGLGNGLMVMNDGGRVNAEENLSKTEVGKLLTEEAMKLDIPPEIAKAIAFKESKWEQDAVGSDEKGVGIMQVTDQRFDQEKLKNDIHYNIQSGLQILNEKFEGKDGKLPTVNQNDRDVLESWYFAILAYNGQGTTE